MSERYGHKKYQNDALEILGDYLLKCREAENPGHAFTVVTEVPYNTISEVEGGASMPADMPFVCLRVPTGGGKTVIGARAIKVAKDTLLDTDHPFVLWLVPSDAICKQTLGAMRDRSNPLRQVLEEELGQVEILDGEQALSLTPAALGAGAVIIVTTIQSFRVEDVQIRKVYGNNGQLMDHFGHIPLEVKNQFPEGFPHSLANVLRMHRPLVIVDEAQNARSPLSMQVLERFQPRAIIELTATPEAKKNPSNVLVSISAAELKAENMVKLPIVLQAETGFKEIMTAAIAMRGQLETEAKAEQSETGEYIRPILLFQAEPHDQNRPDALTVEVLETALREEHNIPENQIAVATGTVRGLDGVNLNADDCKIRYVITQSALKEGWDCPFAYVLCSLANLRSSTAVEQILGRILRMPRAERKKREILNRAYAFVRSPHFYVAAEALKDSLVKGAGYDQKEVSDFFVPKEPKQTGLALDVNGTRTISLDLTSPVPALPEKVSDFAKVTDGKKLTITGHPKKKQVDELLESLASDEDREVVKAAIDELQSHEQIFASPAERGEEFLVPQLMLQFGDTIVSPDEASWLETGWTLPRPPRDEDIPSLAANARTDSVGIVDVENGKVITRQVPGFAAELALVEIQENWSQEKLVSWLDRNIPHDDIDPGDSLAWLDGVTHRLLESNKLGRLVRERFELRRRLETRIAELRKLARQQAYQDVLFGNLDTVKVRVGDGYHFRYNNDIYPCNRVCGRSSEFNKHYYEHVGELKEQGEEFNCAKLIDSLPNVEFWVRNLERQPVYSFWLQTSTDRFYPDFVVKLKSGKVLVVEYKGEGLATTDDTKEKERLGNLWAERSGGSCIFLMVKGPNDLNRIELVVG